MTLLKMRAVLAIYAHGLRRMQREEPKLAEQRSWQVAMQCMQLLQTPELQALFPKTVAPSALQRALHARRSEEPDDIFNAHLQAALGKVPGEQPVLGDYLFNAATALFAEAVRLAKRAQTQD